MKPAGVIGEFVLTLIDARVETNSVWPGSAWVWCGARPPFPIWENLAQTESGSLTQKPPTSHPRLPHPQLDRPNDSTNPPILMQRDLLKARLGKLPELPAIDSNGVELTEEEAEEARDDFLIKPAVLPKKFVNRSRVIQSTEFQRC